MPRALVVATLLLVAVGAPFAAHAPGAAPRVVLVDFADITWAPGPEILVAATPRRGPSGLYAIDAASRVRLIAHNAGCARWSPDGTRVAFVQNGVLVTERADGS